MSNQNKNNRDPRRLVAGLVIIILSVSIFLFLVATIGLQGIFYCLNQTQCCGDWPRYLWVLIWCLIGLGMAAISASFNTSLEDKTFWMNYFLFYPLVVFLISIIVFISLNELEISSNYLFYFFTPPVSLLFSFKIDEIHRKIPSLFGK